jgi:recombinational DNA repair protein RecR
MKNDKSVLINDLKEVQQKIKKHCQFCDYKNHFHLCHIKDIFKFDKSTKLKVVNDPKNLIFLCPNHHWDLDHGKLEL